ncbi:hypothetical protein CYMTET_2869 [Cymbomonas tetramitiformis]|uniref:Uncharacterized protein n=1 Tax=Cymbomonas tetramitiformis TaxID=36881 RepID=A0AAE0H4X0_9CHLO|nr:hypothetical protein CYMTET_2869 [Cymbomonas tetramitiformis]
MNMRDVYATQTMPTLPPISSSDSALCACLKQTLDALRNERSVRSSNHKRPLLEYKVDAFKRKLSRVDAEREVPGDKYLKDVHAYLDSFGMERTNSQKQFHKAFLGATLAHIYGPGDFERHRTRILAQNNMSDPSFEVLVVTPRRWGKTTSVAMFVAALLLSVADMWVSVFSTGQRASSSLLEQVCKMICHVPRGSSRILRRNQEQVFIKGDASSDVRRLYSYPSSVQGEVSM